MKIKNFSITLAAAICFSLTTFAYAAGNGDTLRDRDRLQLKDGSCQTVATAGKGDTLRDRDRLQLKDGSCQTVAMAGKGDTLRDHDRLQLKNGSCQL